MIEELQFPLSLVASNVEPLEVSGEYVSLSSLYVLGMFCYVLEYEYTPEYCASGFPILGRCACANFWSGVLRG